MNSCSLPLLREAQPGQSTQCPCANRKQIPSSRGSQHRPWPAERRRDFSPAARRLWQLAHLSVGTPPDFTFDPQTSNNNYWMEEVEGTCLLLGGRRFNLYLPTLWSCKCLSVHLSAFFLNFNNSQNRTATHNTREEMERTMQFRLWIDLNGGWMTGQTSYDPVKCR